MSTVSVIDRARATIVLDHPFFASILLKRPFVETEAIPTLAVDNRGTIYFNRKFAESLTTKQLVWALCHEVLHYASMHGIRQGHRDKFKWNFAGDAWINDTLNDMGIGEPIPKTVNIPGSKDKTVEQIYAELPDDGDGKGKGKGSAGAAGGSPQGQGDGDPMEGDLLPGERQMTESEAKEVEAQAKLDVAEAGQVAKMRGKLPAALQKFVSDVIESKVPWFDILERYMTERVKTDISWSRPNRRYMPEYYLPTQDGVGAMGEMVIQIDVSGSVSAQELAHYSGHMKRIAEQVRPQKVHVIYTDTQVCHHDLFERPEDIELTHRTGGGTDMRAGFEWIAQQGITPEVVVTLTDGYTPWPDDTEWPAVWCISSDQKAPCGLNIKFDLGNDAS